MCRLAAVLHHGRLILLAHSARSCLRTCSRCHSLSVGSLSPPSQKQNAPRNLRFSSGTNYFVTQGEFNSSLPRSSTLSPPPPSLSNLASCRRIRLCRILTCVGCCLRARRSRLSIAALPLLPIKRRANRRCPCLTHHVRPHSTATPKPRGHAQQQEAITP